MNKKVGEKIRQLRVLKGLSQENVAEELGMSHGNFGKIERGEIEANSSKLIEIAKVLKVSPAEFFQTKEVKPDYGYATKEELNEVAQALHAFMEKFDKFTEEFSSKKKTPKKSYTKKK